MTVARYAPERTSARDRVHAYSVWEVAVFLLNVLAFLLMGLQARTIVERLVGQNLWPSLLFALMVFAIVVAVRVVWVLIYNRTRWLVAHAQHRKDGPSVRQGLVVVWCGMRGLVTLAAALSYHLAFRTATCWF